MKHLPTGTVTFLFTDIEASTSLWEKHRAAMQSAVARHDALLRHVIEFHNGYVFKTVGDAFCATFARANDALNAALAVQRALQNENWGETPLRVRMALHSGSAEERDGDYFGRAVNRVARLVSAGYGNQVLLSRATVDLLQDQLPPDVTLRDLGERKLKDLERPENIFQLVAPDLPSDFPPLKTLDTLPTNLPVQLTLFVGREKELGEVKRLLESTRLLTLTGVGGTGKTRLALQLAAQTADHFHEGVWFVEFAPLTDPALVPQSVAQVLSLQESPERTLTEMLALFIRDKYMLLVFDNCEHLIAACAELAEKLLLACPHLKILATSREELNIAGETIWRVPSLATPNLQQLPAADELERFDAIQLFIQRASALEPNWKIEHNPLAVAQICARLDGIPLALELAAARVKGLSTEQIAARLDDRFRLLTGGSRTALPRQRTLQAAIDWSYKLLSERERVLLQRLSVFAGSWRLDAAEYVCAGKTLAGNEILDHLLQLVDKSLVIADTTETETRYRFYETIRQYAQEKLDDAGEGEAIRNRHLDYFMKLAEEAAPKLRGINQKEWMHSLETEHDNLRAALRWSLENPNGDPNKKTWALRLSGALGNFWYGHSHWSEGRRWLKQALKYAEDTSPAVRAKALLAAGSLANWQNNYEEGEALLEQSLALYQMENDKSNIALTLFWLGMARGDQGDYERSIQLVEESLELHRQIGDKSGVSYSLHLLGEAAQGLGDYNRARQLFEESLKLSRELNDMWGIGLNLSGLGQIALRERDYELATEFFEKNLALYSELGDKRMSGIALDYLGFVAHGKGDNATAHALLGQALRLLSDLHDGWSIARILERLATINALEQDAERAARIFGSAEVFRQAVNLPIAPGDRAEYESNVAAVRAQLDEATFNAAWEEGRKMTMEEAVAFALENVK